MKTQSNTTKSLILFTALGTSLSAATIALPYEEVCINNSDKAIHYETAVNNPYMNLINQVDESYSLWQNNSEIDKINSIIALSERIISNSKDIESEYVEIVNDNFWDLI
ncbi:hypothetical protein OU798_15970 [Prolixibacteraceae bacterium Z1-6]|uniref:Uncharacterized protein n=1 Tax=Draconibacterium aestuarii TaxID=2998507 RepID=A0A9X3F8M0_9BACT|nr:hypothetical protein [Prolixibacteraceae bacterium Z1-6]